MTTPHSGLKYLRPDEMAECHDVSEALYTKLWEVISTKKPLSHFIDIEDSSPQDAIGINNIADAWAEFTEEEKVELNSVMAKEDKEWEEFCNDD